MDARDLRTIVREVLSELERRAAGAPAPSAPIAPAGGAPMVVIGSDAEALVVAKRLAAAGRRVQLFGLAETQEFRDAAARASLPLAARATDLELRPGAAIVAMLPALAHQSLAILLREVIPDETTILLLPGQTGGALALAHALDLKKRRLVIGESSVAPLVAGWEDGEPVVYLEFGEVPLAAIPAREGARAAAVLEGVVKVRPAASVLETSLHNPALVLSTVPLLLSAQRALTEGGTYFDLFVPPILEAMQALDEERLAVAKAAGVAAEPLPEWLARALGAEACSLESGCGAFARVPLPEFYDPRFLVDGVPNGLVPLVELADALKVPAPTANAVLDLSAAAMRADYRVGGRRLQTFGLDAASNVSQQLSQLAGLEV